MEQVSIVVAAWIPCLVILSMIVYTLRKCIPPVKLFETLFSFLLGGIATSLFCAFWQWAFERWAVPLQTWPYVYYLFQSFFIAAMPEEMCRYLILHWRLPRLTPPVNLMTCLLMGSIVGLGLGTVEYTSYSARDGWGTVWDRLFTGVPCHTMAGAIVGYFVGLSMMQRRIKWGILGVSITILLHTTNNFGIALLHLSSPQADVDDSFLSSTFPIRILMTLIYAGFVMILFRRANRASQQQMQCL